MCESVCVCVVVCMCARVGRVVDVFLLNSFFVLVTETKGAAEPQNNLPAEPPQNLPVHT